MDRRRVDWSTFLDPEAPPPMVLNGPGSSDLASMLSTFAELIALDDADAVLKRAVEIARERIGMKRAAIFLRDENRRLMLGTWGTDLDGATVDEHSIMFDMEPENEEPYRRAEREGVHWTVVENAPIVVHLANTTRVVGRGSVCCTPIRSTVGPLGMMFNDAGLSGASVDDAKQAQGAVLCSLLGAALDVCRRQPWRSWDTARVSTRAPVVARAVKLLANDPDLTCEALGAKLGLSGSRMARLFKSEMGKSIVEYRNQLRLERFSLLLDRTGQNLLEAALMAGFGSYAQFHRVFSAARGATPREHLRATAAAGRRK